MTEFHLPSAPPPTTSVRHLAFFRAAAAARPGSSEYRTLTAGLLVLRLLDKWRLQRQAQREVKFHEFLAVKRTVETIEEGPLRQTLIALVDTVSEFAHGSADARVTHLIQYARMLEQDAQWEPAVDVYETVIEIIPEQPRDAERLPVCYHQTADCLRRLGEMDRADAAIASGLAAASAMHDVSWWLKLRIAHASLELHKGDRPAAERELDAVIEDARRADLPQVAAQAQHDRGHVAYTSNQYELAAELFYAALGAYDDARQKQHAMQDLGTALADLGHLVYARRVYSVVRQWPTETADMRALAGLNLMRISVLAGDAVKFERLRRELTGEGMPGRLRAHYHLISGQGLRQFGDNVNARDEFEHAIIAAEASHVYTVVIDGDAMLRSMPDERPVPWRSMSPNPRLTAILHEIAQKRGEFASATE